MILNFCETCLNIWAQLVSGLKVLLCCLLTETSEQTQSVFGHALLQNLKEFDFVCTTVYFSEKFTVYTCKGVFALRLGLNPVRFSQKKWFLSPTVTDSTSLQSQYDVYKKFTQSGIVSRTSTQSELWTIEPQYIRIFGLLESELQTDFPWKQKKTFKE